MAGLVLIGLGLALYFALSRTEVSRALSQGQPVHLLWALRLSPEDPPDLAVTVTLLPRGAVAFLLIPGTVAVPTKTGWSTLSAVYAQGGLPAWKTLLSDLLEFSFFAAVEVGPGEWDKLVEGAGGVVVRLGERLVFRDEARGFALDLPFGEQLIPGKTSRDFLLYAVRYAEDPQFSLASSFFRDLLARVWAKGRGILPFLRLGKTWNEQEFWRRALSLPEEAIQLAIIPVIRENARLMPDFVAMRKLRERIVSGRVFLTRDEVRVTVLNGTRERFLATRTASWLSARGFTVVGVGSADRFDYGKTVLVVGTGAEEKAELLRRVLPADVVVTTKDAFGQEKLGKWATEADVILVVGAGFDVGG